MKRREYLANFEGVVYLQEELAFQCRYGGRLWAVRVLFAIFGLRQFYHTDQTSPLASTVLPALKFGRRHPPEGGA